MLVHQPAPAFRLPFPWRAPPSFAQFSPASFGYFARRYGLRQLAVEGGGSEPGPRHMVMLARAVRDSGARFMLVQPQFSPQRAQSLANSLEVELVEVDPLAADVESMLRHLARTLSPSAHPVRCGTETQR